MNLAQAPLILQSLHLSQGSERVQHAQSICVRRKPLGKCFKNVFMNKKARRRCAYLASIAVLGRNTCSSYLINIDIVPDYNWGVSAQLQRGLLHVQRRLCTQLFAHLCSTCDRDHGHLWRCATLIGDRRRVAKYHIAGAARQRSEKQTSELPSLMS